MVYKVLHKNFHFQLKVDFYYQEMALTTRNVISDWFYIASFFNGQPICRFSNKVDSNQNRAQRLPCSERRHG